MTSRPSGVYFTAKRGENDGVWEIKRIKGKTIRKIAAGLFLVATAAAFSGMAGVGAEFLHVQFGPSLLSVCTAFSAGSLAALIGIAVVTFVFGRFYCAVFCPLGILQDVAAFVFRRRKAFEKNAALVRYVVAGVVYGMLIAGWSVGFFLLDPYSITGRIAVSFSIGALAPFLIVLALGVWRRRFYCVALCPVGTLLGLIAGHGVYRLRITGKCVRCGKCVGECPSGCIDLEAGVAERCWSDSRADSLWQRREWENWRLSRDASGFCRPEREMRCGSPPGARGVSCARQTVRQRLSGRRNTGRDRYRWIFRRGRAGLTVIGVRRCVRRARFVR